MIRHFVHSRVFRSTIDKHKVDIILPPLGHKRITLKPDEYLEGSEIIRLNVDTKNRSLWGRLIQVMVMKPRFNKGLYLRRTWN